MRLYTVRNGVERPALTLQDRPRYVGRSPANDLVLDLELTISQEHAALWIEDGAAWIRDLGSSNGTFVNGQKVQRRAKLADGDAVQLGSVAFVVRGGIGEAAPRPRVFLLEDVDSGVRYPFQGQQLVVGPSAHAHVMLDVDDDDEVALTVDPDGDLWLSRLEEEAALTVDAVFTIADRSFRVIQTEGV
jgi:predicted component of type VI protein secretion system